MLIRNNRTGDVVARDVVEYTRWWQHVRGLMFASPKNILFTFNEERARSLHMWFVFYPIDVIFLDAERTVVDVRERFRPFSTYRCEQPSRYVLELVTGLGDVACGDTLLIEKDL